MERPQRPEPLCCALLGPDETTPVGADVGADVGAQVSVRVHFGVSVYLSFTVHP